MSTKDLAAKYGRGNSTRLINRAIEAELPGGREALEAFRVVRELRLRDDDAVLVALRAVLSAMSAEIRRRYGLPPRSD